MITNDLSPTVAYGKRRHELRTMAATRMLRLDSSIGQLAPCPSRCSQPLTDTWFLASAIMVTAMRKTP